LRYQPTTTPSSGGSMRCAAASAWATTRSLAPSTIICGTRTAPCTITYGIPVSGVSNTRPTRKPSSASCGAETRWSSTAARARCAIKMRLGSSSGVPATPNGGGRLGLGAGRGRRAGPASGDLERRDGWWFQVRVLDPHLGEGFAAARRAMRVIEHVQVVDVLDPIGPAEHARVLEELVLLDLAQPVRPIELVDRE